MKIEVDWNHVKEYFPNMHETLSKNGFNTNRNTVNFKKIRKFLEKKFSIVIDIDFYLDMFNGKKKCLWLYRIVDNEMKPLDRCMADSFRPKFDYYFEACKQSIYKAFFILNNRN